MIMHKNNTQCPFQEMLMNCNKCKKKCCKKYKKGKKQCKRCPKLEQ